MLNKYIEIWINTNKNANPEPLDHFFDVEMKIDKNNTIVFECADEQSAIQFKSRLTDLLEEEYVINMRLN